MERRLSAILAVDVVGYSRLMERDEADTFERLRAHRKDLFEPEIAAHHGRIFKLTGDGLLAEFGSVVDAVECAVLLQRGMAERNNGLADGQRIDVRMGINLGDVIIEDDDRHGEGVVIAARLQQLAEPGGIAVSGTVVDHVGNKLALRFEPRGQERLKNIATPVAVYRVVPRGSESLKAASRVKFRIWTAAAALLLLVGGGVAAAIYAIPLPDEPPPDQGIPVIIVLPFQDRTGSQLGGGAVDLANVGAGIADEFITDLSTFPDFQVVSSTTSSALAGKSIPDIVKHTGATFVVEGSIRASADKTMITMQLIDGKTDRHLRIAQIEETIADPVVMQKTVVAKLRDELGGMSGVLRNELNRIAESKRESELTEYDYYLLGHIHMQRGWQSEIRLAEEIWNRGLARFPNSVLLRCRLSLVESWNNRPINALRYVEETIAGRKKSRLDEWYVHYAKAVALSLTTDRNRAGTEARTVLEMAPYDAMVHVQMAAVLSMTMFYDESIEALKFGITHDRTPRKWYFNDILSIYRIAGRMNELVSLAETQMKENPRYARPWCNVLGTAYYSTGQDEKAKATWKACPGFPDPPES